jgi:hypothetical protein
MLPLSSAALAAEASARREAAKQQIKELRREGAALLRQYRPLAAQIKTAQQQRLKLHGALVQARDQIAIYSVPLDPETFPSDADLAAHAEQLDLWKGRQKELLAQVEDARNREAARPQAMAIQNRLRHMQFEIRNLTSIAEGRRPGEIEGGLFSVENFLS